MVLDSAQILSFLSSYGTELSPFSSCVSLCDCFPLTLASILRPATSKMGVVNDDDRPSHFVAQREALPIFPLRFSLVAEARKHECMIVIGETASGKTTQIPQFLLEAGINRNGIIGITQPRRVAAVTIAERVAKEVGTPLGSLVGYCVRFEDVTSEATKIKYVTDGMLLREAISDPLLRKYSVIILDEAHERTIHTDVLFGVVKSAQMLRKERHMPPLKIIIMSATMDADHFSEYFNKAPVYYIKGRQFPVKVMYVYQEQQDYVFAALVTVFQIHQSEPQGDILVFCTGQEEIESVVRAAKETIPQLPSGCLTLLPYPLYAALPSSQQLKVFQPTPKDCRKVIFSTNIAETSVTIPGIKYVVDTGMVKARTYHPLVGLDLLKVQRISKAQAWQRTGRAGRESSGSCYRLYTKEEYANMTDHSVPEIQRCNLANVVLQLLAIGIHDAIKFDFLDKPSEEALANATDQLQMLGAIEKQDRLQLTSVGKTLSTFPLEPQFGKILLMSKNLRCTEEILTIISVLSVESVILSSVKKKDLAADVRKKFESSEGDHVMLLNIYRAFRGANENKHWCHENFLNYQNLKMAVEVRKQLMDLCRRAGIPPRSCGQNMEVVRKCIAYGLFGNAAELQSDGQYLTLNTRQQVNIHPSSCLFRCKPAYVLYTELVQTTKCYMRNLSVVSPEWLVEIAPSFFKSKLKRAV